MSEREIAGKTIEFGEDGFMVDYTTWTKEVGMELAGEINIELSDRHWEVIDFCRADYAAQGDAPTMRRITKESGVPTKELYKLFPKGPAKKVAYVSGLKKPSGCI